MALAQAVVNRMGQLSLRVSQMLDVNRPGATALWKPAIPLVLAVASLRGISAWHAPALIAFEDHRPQRQETQNNATTRPGSPAQQADTGSHASVTEPKLVLASLDHKKPSTALATATKRPRGPKLLQAKVITSAGNYFIQQQAVIITTSGNGQSVWQLRMWEVRITIPDASYRKTQAPRKST